MLLLSILLSTGFANQVLVPHFDASDTTSKVGAEIVYSAVLEALSDRDIRVLDQDDLRRFIGGQADGCPKRPTCPEDLWPEINGQIAIIGSVTMVGEDVSTSLQFYQRGAKDPVDFFQADFPAEKAGYFAVDAALITSDLLKATKDDLAAFGVAAGGAVAVNDTAPQDTVASPAEPTSDPAPATQEPAPSNTQKTAHLAPPESPASVTAINMTEDEERRHMGLPRSLYNEFKASNMSRAAFLEAKRFRAKTFFAEFSPGLVFGDIQRRYTAVARVVAGSPEAYYERDEFLPGTAFSLMAGVGYAPTWWLELGLNIGLEFPKKDFVSGFEQYADMGTDWGSGHNCPEFCDLTAFKPATALTFVFEPRVRFLMVPSGLLKPYLVTGWTTRIYDGYDTPDYTTVAYPNRTGVQTYGPTVGLGAGFDYHKRASVFLEMSYTHLLGPGIFDAGLDEVQVLPKTEEGVGGVFSIRTGFTTRF